MINKFLPNLMKLLLLPYALCLIGCSLVDNESLPENAFIIRNITVIDAVEGVRETMDVLIVGDTISGIYPPGSHEFLAPKDLDGTGKYLIPGLWDAHVHLAYTADINYETFFPLSLAHGVTSLRDTGGHLDLLRPALDMAASDAITPDLYISGPLIDGPLRIYDGHSASNPDLSIGVSTPEEAAYSVDALAAAGVDFVKAYEMLSPETFRAVVNRAEYHDLPVSMHIPLTMSVSEAIEAGANDMQHLRNLEFDCARNANDILRKRRQMVKANSSESPAELRKDIHSAMRNLAMPQQDEQKCQAVISALAEAEVYQTPTLVISRFFSRKLFADEVYRESFDLMPQTVASAWRERSQRLANYPVSPEQKAYDDWVKAIIPRLRDTGVPIMAGTDAPIGFLTPGASLHEELSELVAAGLTPLEAIGSATIIPAQFFNLDDEMGAIQAGMKADLVILNENPIENIRNISAIDSVVKDGHVLKRDALDALLSKPSD